MRPLNEKQKRFAREYVKDLNATQAAIRAGYSEKSAYSQAHDLLKNPKVKNFIEQLSEKRNSKLEISAERVLLEISRLAFFDPRKLFDDAGMPIHISQLDDDTAAAIAGIEVCTQGNDKMGLGEIRKYKLSDKSKNLELLARHLKLLTDKVEVGGMPGQPVETVNTHGPMDAATAMKNYRDLIKNMKAKK